MANLFPLETDFEELNIQNNDDIEFKGSYKFDFDKGEFIKNVDGTIAKCNEEEAYIQWCQKVMRTPRFLLAYSDLFGHEIDSLRGSKLSKEAIELEVKRMTKEALMVHPKTIDVDNFKFTWNDGNLYYEYNINSYYNNSTLSNELKVR